MREPDMTNRELKIWLTGEFNALRTEMNGEFKLVREEIKTRQSEFHGEIGRMDARIGGQKAWDMAELKIGDTIEKKNQPELELGNHPKH